MEEDNTVHDASDTSSENELTWEIRVDVVHQSSGVADEPEKNHGEAGQRWIPQIFYALLDAVFPSLGSSDETVTELGDRPSELEHEDRVETEEENAIDGDGVAEKDNIAAKSFPLPKPLDRNRWSLAAYFLCLQDPARWRRGQGSCALLRRKL